MKLKKFFAGIVAAAMMLTVGATAVLADGPAASTVTVPGTGINGVKMFTAEEHQLTLTKTLAVNNGTAPDHMEFSFTVNGVADATTKAEFDATKGQLFTKGKYTANFNIDLEKVLGTNKTKVGEYTYTISEDNTQIPGITKDDKELTLKVTVVNATGEIDNSYGYYVALYRDGKKIEATDAFHNTYDAKGLTLTKTVHGSLGDLNEDFQFDIKFVPEKDEIASLYKGVQVGDLGKASIANATAGAYLNLNTVYTVTMKHNGSLSFANLPAGIKYEVYEVGSAVSGDKVMKNQYTVTVTDTAFVENSNTVKGTAAAEDVTVAFQNTHEGVPDTGVILDNAPYIALLAIVAIGGVALMLNKRRRDEE